MHKRMCNRSHTKVHSCSPRDRGLGLGLEASMSAVVETDQ